MSNRTTPDHEPITVLFTWEVTPGREDDFEGWLRDINSEAARFPGHQGVTWLRPEGEGHRFYAVLRFSDEPSLRNWTSSPERAAQVKRVEGIAVEAEPRLSTTGLETWFSLPRRVVRPPARWKMTVVSFIAVYPCVVLFQLLAGPRLETWPLPLRALILPLMLSPLLTYAIMPFLSRVLRNFLYTG
jgi:uncharacterized protein